MVQFSPAQQRAWYAKCKLAALQQHVYGLPANVLAGCTLRQLSFKVRALGHGQQTLGMALHAYCQKSSVDTDAHPADMGAKSTRVSPEQASASCEPTPQEQEAYAFIETDSSWKLASKDTLDCEIACCPP